MTESEKVLWEYVRMKPLGFKFHRQHPINRYVLDFYCHKARFSIEIDGAHHIDPEQKQADLERTEYLNEVGIREIRFWNSQVLTDLNGVKKIVEEELCESPFRVGARGINNQ